MDSAWLLTQLPLIMGLSNAALVLIVIIALSTPLTSLCYSSPCSFTAIKSVCVEYICSLWSLLHPPTDQQPRNLFSPRNLFVLVNIIVLVLLINLHLRQHAASAAAVKRSSRRKNHHQPESLTENVKALTPLQVSSLADDDVGLVAAAAMAKEALSKSARAAEKDSEAYSIAGSPIMQVSNGLQERSTFESRHIDGSDTEQIVLDEEGRLRLISGLKPPIVCTGGTKSGDAESSENGRLGLIESGNGVDEEKEENGQVRLSEVLKGSDTEESVPEEVGRLRSIPRAASRRRKSHSTGDENVNEPSKGKQLIDISDTLNDFSHDSHTRSLSYSNYNIPARSLINSSDSLDSLGESNRSEVSGGVQVIDLSSSPSTPQNLREEVAPHHTASKQKSSSLRRTSSRPMRARKADTLDATWKAINSNKGSGENKPLIRQSSREHKHLIKQMNRQDFKPSGRTGRASGSSSSSKVRREPSISQEELNSKVESFIAKFNEQIRIQRQQSILSYMQMVDRGV